MIARPAIDLRGWIISLAIPLVALGLRLSWAFARPPVISPGGDEILYLTIGWGVAAGLPYYTLMDFGILAVGPLYPLYLAMLFGPATVVLFPGVVQGVDCLARVAGYLYAGCIDVESSFRLVRLDLVIVFARVGQAMMDTLMCMFVRDIGRRLFGRTTGLAAALLLAMDLRFITQTGSITTETLFIFLLVLGVWAFVAARSARRFKTPGCAISVLILFVGALTRPAALPLPALLLASLLLPKPTRRQTVAVGLAIAAGFVAIAAHSIDQYRRTGVVVVISDGVTANFWMGSRGDGQWHGTVEFEKARDEMQARRGTRYAYVEDALNTIAGDPPAYIRLLFRKVTAAYLQPYGTVSFPGESLKELAVKVARGQIGLSELIGGEAFWPKLTVYIFHFGGLAGALIGVWLARRDWTKIAPLVLPVVTLTGVYTFLTIIPRYIFPGMPFVMILAAYAAVTAAGRARDRAGRRG